MKRDKPLYDMFTALKFSSAADTFLDKHCKPDNIEEQLAERKVSGIKFIVPDSFTTDDEGSGIRCWEFDGNGCFILLICQYLPYEVQAKALGYGIACSFLHNLTYIPPKLYDFSPEQLLETEDFCEEFSNHWLEKVTAESAAAYLRKKAEAQSRACALLQGGKKDLTVTVKERKELCHEKRTQCSTEGLWASKEP